MTKRLRDLLQEARTRKDELDQQAQNNFAYRLASQSVASHIEDLAQQLAALEDRPILEVVDFPPHRDTAQGRIGAPRADRKGC